jgi:MFS family permease
MDGSKTFFRLWLGQCVSGIGSQLTSFGLGVWVYQQTRSVTAMAMIFMAAAVPGIVLSPAIGAWIDRVDRKKALLFADSFAGVFSLFLVVVLVFGKLDVWMIYLVAAAGSAANTIMWPALSATTSLLVPKEQLGRANGLLQFGEAGSMILAPVIGGVVLVATGIQGLVAIDVASFVFAITMTLMCRVPRPAATDEGRRASQGLWNEASFGFRFIAARPGLMAMLAYFMFINLVLPISQTLFGPLILSHYSPSALGLVQTIAGVGMLVGTAVMAGWGGPKRKIHGFAIFGAVCCGSMALMLLPLSVMTVSLMAFTIMVSSPIVNACSQTIWQRKTPADVQGKVFVARRMIAWFMTPLAFGIAGPLADRVFEPGGHPAAWLVGLVGNEPGAGLRAMFVVSGVLTLAATGLAFMFPRFRNVEDELPDAELKAEEEGTGTLSLSPALATSEAT